VRVQYCFGGGSGPLSASTINSWNGAIIWIEPSGWAPSKEYGQSHMHLVCGLVEFYKAKAGWASTPNRHSMYHCRHCCCWFADATITSSSSSSSCNNQIVAVLTSLLRYNITLSSSLPWCGAR
jgi:hypothetical protein